jgi:hypothetical protein
MGKTKELFQSLREKEDNNDNGYHSLLEESYVRTAFKKSVKKQTVKRVSKK